MKSEAEKEVERYRDRERQRRHMEKVEQHLDESRRHAERNSPQQLQMNAAQSELIIKGGGAIIALIALFFALFFFALFIISPGALTVIFALKERSDTITISEHWLYSGIISLVILVVIYLSSRSIKKTILIYSVVCVASSAIAFIATIENKKAIDYATEKFWPFQEKINNEAQKTVQHTNGLPQETAPTEEMEKTINDLPQLPTSLQMQRD
jgi:hypothetical protein